LFRFFCYIVNDSVYCGVNVIRPLVMVHIINLCPCYIMMTMIMSYINRPPTVLLLREYLYAIYCIYIYKCFLCTSIAIFNSQNLVFCAYSVKPVLQIWSIFVQARIRPKKKFDPVLHQLISKKICILTFYMCISSPR
jgi:hypothetical protein